MLKPDGFAEVRVPDLAMVMRHVVENNLDIEDPLYYLREAPILVRDVIYGYSPEIARVGEAYAHKTGYTPKSLRAALLSGGFGWVGIAREYDWEILAFAFRQPPSPQAFALISLPAGFARAVQDLPGARRTAVFTAGTDWMTRSRDVSGRTVDRPGGGMAIPLDVGSSPASLGAAGGGARAGSWRRIRASRSASAGVGSIPSSSRSSARSR